MTELQKLEQAITALEAQRAILGDSIVETALAPLREKITALQPQAKTEQRKYVTVLFADISGYTALSETMDAEDVRNAVNDLWQQLDTIITGLGGRIDKHI